MTLKDAIMQSTLVDVLIETGDAGFTDAETQKFMNLWRSLRNMDAVEDSAIQGYFIVSQQRFSICDGVAMYDLVARFVDKYTNRPASLCFVPRRTWLSIPIGNKTLRKYTIEKIVASIMLEMAAFSYDESEVAELAVITDMRQAGIVLGDNNMVKSDPVSICQLLNLTTCDYTDEDIGYKRIQEDDDEYDLEQLNLMLEDVLDEAEGA